MTFALYPFYLYFMGIFQVVSVASTSQAASALLSSCPIQLPLLERLKAAYRLECSEHADWKYFRRTMSYARLTGEIYARTDIPHPLRISLEEGVSVFCIQYHVIPHAMMILLRLCLDITNIPPSYFRNDHSALLPRKPRNDDTRYTHSPFDVAQFRRWDVPGFCRFAWGWQGVFSIFFTVELAPLTVDNRCQFSVPIPPFWRMLSIECPFQERRWQVSNVLYERQ